MGEAIVLVAERGFLLEVQVIEGAGFSKEFARAKLCRPTR